jgi:hypothetical protein
MQSLKPKGEINYSTYFRIVKVSRVLGRMVHEIGWLLQMIVSNDA